MKKNLMRLFIPVMLGSTLFLSCKKDSSPSPGGLSGFGAKTDTIYVKGDSIAFNVLANDTNPSRRTYFEYYNMVMGTLKKKSDTSFTYIKRKDYLGWDQFNYTITMNPGSGYYKQSKAVVYLRIGTDAQWATKTLLENANYKEMSLFAVDGDTSIPQNWGRACGYYYAGLDDFEISFPDFRTPKYRFFLDNKCTIAADGLLSEKVIDGSIAEFKLLGEFKSKAIDKNNNIIDVTGLSFYFLGRKHDYVREFKQLRYQGL